MTSLPDFHGMPNLLELAEAGAGTFSLGAFSVSGDESSGSPLLADLSPRGDESRDGPSLIDLSLCADEGGGLSDIRLKTDIENIGTTVYGLPLYHFRYRTGPERFEGVMAQDVLRVMPDAVAMGEDGYYRVNYARLGIRMSRA